MSLNLWDFLKWPPLHIYIYIFPENLFSEEKLITFTVDWFRDYSSFVKLLSSETWLVLVFVK